jgi:hypothetical protein
VSISVFALPLKNIEMNSFNAVFGAWLGARIPSRLSLHKLTLQTAPRHRPIAFTLEGSPLDRCHE